MNSFSPPKQPFRNSTSGSLLVAALNASGFRSLAVHRARSLRRHAPAYASAVTAGGSAQTRRDSGCFRSGGTRVAHDRETQQVRRLDCRNAGVQHGRKNLQRSRARRTPPAPQSDTVENFFMTKSRSQAVESPDQMPVNRSVESPKLSSSKPPHSIRLRNRLHMRRFGESR